MNIEDELRKEYKDAYNPEFFIKFTLAIKELENDPMGYVVFLNAVVPYLKFFAERNNKTLHELFEAIEKTDKKHPFARLEV